MAPQRQKKRAASPSLSSSSEESQVDSLVDVPFEFDDLDETDFHGIDSLIANGLNVTEHVALTDLVLEQMNIGTTVKTDEDSLVGFGTILNPKQYPDNAGLTELLKNLQDGCRWKGEGDVQLGVVLTERLYNVPGDVGPNMHQVLIDDVEWSLNECPDEERGFYKFERVLIVSSALRESGEGSGDGKLRKVGKKQKKSSSRIYVHPEDEIFVEFAGATYEQEIGEHDDGKMKFKKYRFIYTLDWENYKIATQRALEALITV